MSKQQFQVGDLIKAEGVLGNGVMFYRRGTIEKIAPSGAIQLQEMADDEWHTPKQCELILRPHKTEKKKVWVAAWSEHPNNAPSMHQYVQIEAEVPVEE